MVRTVDQVLVTYDTLRRSSMEIAVLGSYARRMAGTVGGYSSSVYDIVWL